MKSKRKLKGASKYLKLAAFHSRKAAMYYRKANKSVF